MELRQLTPNGTWCDLVFEDASTLGYRGTLTRYHSGISALDRPERRVDSRIVRIRVLGPLEVDETSSQLGPRDRVVLTALAMSPGELLTPQQLAQAVWGEQPPTSWSKIVQGCVSRLRKRLGPEAIETSAHGYRLRLPAETVDAVEFARSAGHARELLTLKEFEHARYVANRALELWRGRPLADLERWKAGAAQARRLRELHSDLEEISVEAALAAGHHREVLAQASAMVEAAPLNEGRWILLARAQYQSGDQHGALRTLRRLRVVLQRELGLDPSLELVALEQAILRQDPELLVAAAPDAREGVSPYPGLTPYGEGEAESFFGREDDVATCLNRLESVPLLAVVGPSGSGKSSLLRAGLAPPLRRGGADIKAMTPGRHPMDALKATRARRTSVLLVDQAEEVFSICSDEAERAKFLTALVAHVERGRVVLALRADYTGELSGYQGFAGLVETGLFLLPVMSPGELRSAIEGPARLHGLVLEPGLADLLVREVEGEPGALPMLSHALRETWLRHEGRTLTVAGYQASGGIRGAVAQSAEQLYARLDEQDRLMVRELVLRLVVPGPEGEPVRGRMPRHQVVVAQAQDHLVDQMVAARLVTSDEGVIELAHEAVVRAWPRLRDWLEDDLEGQRTRHRLTQATEDWSALEFPESELYRGARLAAVQEWVGTAHPQLTDLEERFLVASGELAEAEERSAVELARARGRMVRRLRLALGGAMVLLVLALVSGFLAVGQTRKADRSSLSADAARIGAQALVTTDIAKSLLMAVAGARLDPSPVTQRNLDAALAQHPQLVGSATVPTRSDLSGLAISSDGSTLAMTDKSHHVWTYNAQTLTPLKSAQIGDEGPANFDTPIAFSPTGDSLAVGAPPSDAGPLLRLLDPGTLRPLTDQLEGWPHRWGQIVGLAYSADGRFLAAGLDVGQRANTRSPTNGIGVALVWNVRAPGRPLVRRVPLHWASYDHVALSSEGRTLYGAMPLTAYDLRTGTRQIQSVTQGSGVLAIDPTGRLLAVALDTGAVSLVNARTGRAVKQLHGLVGDVNQVAFSHDEPGWPRPPEMGLPSFGASLARVGRSRRISSSNSGTGRSSQTASRSATTTAPCSPPRPTRMSLHAWDLTGRRSVLPSLPIERPFALSAAFMRPSPQGDALAAIQNGGDLAPRTGHPEFRFVDVTSGTTTRPLVTRHAAYGGGGSWSPDGRRYAASYGDGWVEVVSRDTHRLVVQRHVIHGFAYEVSYTPDGRRIAVDNSNGEVELLDAATLRPVGHPVHLPGTATWEMAAGPDNRTAFVTSADRKPGIGWSTAVSHWWLVDLISGRILKHGDLGVDALYTAFSPRGDRVAISGFGGRIELLDPATGTEVRPPVVGHNGDVYWVTFNADGSRIASGSNAGDVALWDGRTGELLSTAKVPGEERVVIAGFRPDGSLTVASFTGLVYRWDPGLSHAIQFACQAAGRDITRSEWAQELPGRAYQSVCPSTDRQSGSPPPPPAALERISRPH